MADAKSPVYRALDRFFHTYLVDRDLEGTLALLTEDVYSLGTGADEVAGSRAAFEALLRAELSVLPDPIPYAIGDYQEKETGPGVWECLCQVTTLLPVERGPVQTYTTRFTGSFREREGEYLASVLHMSEPSAGQGPNEFLPLRAFSAGSSQDMVVLSQHGLVDLLGEILPGGVVGAYLEEGFPFYAVNDSMLDMLGYTYEEFLAETEGLFCNAIHPDDRALLDDFFRQEEGIGGRYEMEYRMRRKDGSYLWVYDTGKRISTEEGRGATICLVMDMTRRVQEQERLLWEARMDPLTGLYNRRGGIEAIEKALESGKPWLLLLLDIDFFKQVNDLYGHQEGDAILCYVAQLLKSSFRGSDILVRMGGDEFVAFLQPCGDPEAIQRKLEKIGRLYQEKVQAHCPLSGSTLSFGGLYGSGTASFSALCREADQLLYMCKQDGRGRYQLQALDRGTALLRGKTCLSALER